MAEQAPRNPRTIALEKNQKKPAGEPASDRNTGAPAPQDHVKGDYQSWGGAHRGNPERGASDKAAH